MGFLFVGMDNKPLFQLNKGERSHPGLVGRSGLAAGLGVVLQRSSEADYTGADSRAERIKTA
jgi:hypothetical protein